MNGLLLKLDTALSRSASFYLLSLFSGRMPKVEGSRADRVPVPLHFIETGEYPRIEGSRVEYLPFS